MCGIFGIILQDKKLEEYEDFEHALRLLFTLSQVRGQDTAGLAISYDNEIKILRRMTKPSVMLKDPLFKRTLKSAYFNIGKTANQKTRLITIGHCRLVTHGSFAVHGNNQPINAGHIVGVHNGIVLNAEELDSMDGGSIVNHVQHSSISTESGMSESDTKLFISRINSLYEKTGNLVASVSKVFQEIVGSASLALLNGFENNLLLATNTGSLYFSFDTNSGNTVFTSEKKILTDFLHNSRLFSFTPSSQVVKVTPGTGVTFENDDVKKFALKNNDTFLKHIPHQDKFDYKIYDIKSDVSNLKRCTKCILPHTYPFISFDENGVCNFCNRHEKQKFHGSEKLSQILDRYRSKKGDPDCLVGISGGRDSSYGLHILKSKYEMNPIAFTYDWGLTTDTSRRNQAKVCGKLGVEQIIRAPDIQKKRRFVRKNIYAWLRNPELGMVPLFMAGDKDFYHYGRQLRKEVEVDLTVFCSGYLLEQREFFVGFCGVHENVTTTARAYHYNKKTKYKLAHYYILQYLKNLSYINESFYDSIRSYFTTFIQKDDFLYLYEYLPWNENEIETVLKKEYDWEADTAYGTNQWRMGDGQTAFTNYIYYTVAGFSEFDNFRSNQVREGLITRDEALKLAQDDNEPKFETLQYFSYLVGINLDEVLAEINSIPKLY